MPTTQASDKAPEKDDKATSTAAPELREREKVAPAVDEDVKAADRRKAEALRTLGFPEREVKDVREEDGVVIVDHQHGATYRVAEDGTVESENGEGEPAGRNRRVISNGADVPPIVTEAANTQDNGSDDLPLDLEPDAWAHLSEIVDPEEAATEREKVLKRAAADRPAERTAPSGAEGTDKATNADETSGGAATRGTTDAARARKS
jgi:hypothetical protein